MNWREAIQAAARTARVRSKSARDSIGKFGDEHAKEARGAAYAFGVMADELEAVIDPFVPSREALATLRRWSAS